MTLRTAALLALMASGSFAAHAGTSDADSPAASLSVPFSYEEYTQRVNDAFQERVDLIERLEHAGDRKAVGQLRDCLTSENIHPALKRRALLALATIGSKRAIKTITEFEEWAKARYPASPEHWLDNTHHPSHHVGGIWTGTTPTPIATCAVPGGTTWGLFLRDGFWAAKIAGETVVDTPLLLDLPFGSNPDYTNDLLRKHAITLAPGPDADTLLVRAGDETLPVSLAQAARDTDGDGLADCIEQRYGLDAAKADTDGDGVNDREDSNPLTLPNVAHDDRSEIRQAVFTYCMAVNDSHLPVNVRDDAEPAKQEYYGYPGMVLNTDPHIKGVYRISIAIEKVDDKTATVHFGDYLGPLAASGNTIKLKKIHGKWVVVEFKMNEIA